MEKFCFCGKQIPTNMRLCKQHAEEYGTDPEYWDEWLRFLVSDNQREWNAEQRSPEIDMADTEIVQRDPRVTLLETFDDRGYTNFRGCREEAFALIGGKEPDYADGN